MRIRNNGIIGKSVYIDNAFKLPLVNECCIDLNELNRRLIVTKTSRCKAHAREQREYDTSELRNINLRVQVTRQKKKEYIYIYV